MITPDQASVKSYPVLSALAIRHGLAGPMRLFDLMQSLAEMRQGFPFFKRATLIELNLLNPQTD